MVTNSIHIFYFYYPISLGNIKKEFMFTIISSHFSVCLLNFHKTHKNSLKYPVLCTIAESIYIILKSNFILSSINRNSVHQVSRLYLLRWFNWNEIQLMSIKFSFDSWYWKMCTMWVRNKKSLIIWKIMSEIRDSFPITMKD